jgi:hypothetical protein
VTQDRARKKAIRERMAASGEPYSVAARNLAASGPASEEAAVREVIARADATLAAPSARIEIRLDLDGIWSQRGERRPALLARLASSAVKAAWEGAVPAKVRTRLRDTFTRFAAAGIIEPAAGRYQLSGANPWTPYGDDPLDWLRRLHRVSQARYAGDETLRGTPCRKVTASDGAIEFSVWIDEEHIRQAQTVQPALDQSGTMTKTLELWDFGVPVRSPD